MSEVEALLTAMMKEGATLWAEEGQVRFRAPTGVMTQERAAIIRAHKPQALAYLQALGEQRAAEEALVLRAHARTVAPLSTAQTRLWLVEQLGDVGAAYNVPATIRLTGTLDVSALEGALRTVIARHEILRTRFIDGPTGPQQAIDPPGEFTLQYVDLSQMPSEQRAEKIDAWTQLLAFTPFHLGRDPLLRAVLLKTDPRTHLFLLCLHHIICDGWSMAVFVGELTALYQAQRNGVTGVAVLPALRVQYADYAIWERAKLGERLIAPHVAYWREQLAGAPDTTELMGDVPRPAVQSYRGGELPFEVSPATAEALRLLSKQEGTTLFAGMLAAFNALLYRWTGQDDLVVGTPIAGRSHKLIEELIGLFVNMLPIRTRLRASTTFRELVREVAATTLAAYDHQAVPFEQLLELTGSPRDRARQPLFQVVMVCENMPQLSLQLPGLQIEEARVPGRTAKFDLTLFLREQTHGISGYIEYATDLFERATIQRIAQAFQTVLRVVADRPDITVADIDLISPAEREALQGWNSTAVAYPHSSTLHALFEEQAQRIPHQVALIQGEQTLTYAQLNERSNRLAHYLRARGVGPDKLVAVWCERSFELCVAMLGILKAGGAYLPFDPNTPPERGRELLADARPELLLTQEHLRSRLPAMDCEALALDSQWTAISLLPAINLPSASGSNAEHLAYVIYTSGSTGTPKGVMVEHRSVVRLIVNNHFAPLGADDCIVNASNPAFDATTWEIWGGLLQGASVLIIPSMVLLDPALFAQTLIEKRATALWMTVGLFNEYVDKLGEAFEKLRYLLVGGDALEPKAVGRLLQSSHCPKHIVNGYGPTETTTFAATFDIKVVRDGARSIPIGRPIANTRIHILDGAGQQLPIGVPGEICIGGDGVARGYLNRPELTAERFVADPFSKRTRARLYRTGDLGRWREDGTIEFLGRRDGQIKLRGFRVELGEIEARLREVPGVRDALVLVRTIASNPKQLVAYLVLQTEVTLDTNRIRDALATKLPDYMIPAVFVTVSSFPLTANGKVDRRRLPEPTPSITSADVDESPRTEIERTLHAIWCEVLGVDGIARTASFFDVGGNSLLAVRALGRISAQLEVRVPTALLYESPTIAGIATLLQRERSRASQHGLITLRASDSNAAPLFLVHPVGGHLLGYRHLAAELGNGRAVYGLQRPELDTPLEATLLSVAELADQYLKQIVQVRSPSGYCLCGWSFGGLVALELGAKLRALGHHVAYLGIIDTMLMQDGGTDAGLLGLRDMRGSYVSRLLASMSLPLHQRLREVLHAEVSADALLGSSTGQLFEQLHAANLWALYTYEPTFSADEVHCYTATQSAARSDFASSRAALQALCAHPLLMRTIEADHYSIVAPPRVEELAQLIDSDLRVALTERRSARYA